MGSKFEVFVPRATEQFVLARPAAAVVQSAPGDLGVQLPSLVKEALDGLATAGLRPADVFAGRLFCAPQARALGPAELGARLGALAAAPLTFLVQPPAAAGHACELLLHARPGARRARDAWLSSVTPRAALSPDAPVERLARDMFDSASAMLGDIGMSFRDVVRTWIYVRDIDRDYAALNRARNDFFRDQRLTRLPASTGIAGELVSGRWPIAMDVYARPDADAVVETLRAPGMNEAPDYGCAFSRGAIVREHHGDVVYLSGTASIDESGKVVGVGDLELQLRRMFANVEALLGQAGVGFGAARSATAYLKYGSSAPAFAAAARVAGLPQELPLAVVVANVCRPEWLCELELIAERSYSPEMGSPARKTTG